MNRRNQGFTLVEMVITLVILAVLAVGSTRYITATTEGFLMSARISALATGGRIAIERINREVRAAVPNSVRVNGDGNCLEFLPVVGATRYMRVGGLLEATSASYQDGATTTYVGAAGLTKPVPMVTEPVLAPPATEFSVIAPDREVYAEMDEVKYVLVNPLAITGDPSEIYDPGTTPGPVVGYAGIVPNGTGVLADVQLDNLHAFLSHSPSERTYFAGAPVSYCVDIAGILRRYTGYTINPAQFTPGTAPSVLAISDNIANNDPSVDSPVFSYGTSDRTKDIVNVLFEFNDRGQELTLNHEIQMRNTP